MPRRTATFFRSNWRQASNTLKFELLKLCFTLTRIDRGGINKHAPCLEIFYVDVIKIIALVKSSSECMPQVVALGSRCCSCFFFFAAAAIGSAMRSMIPNSSASCALM